MDKGKGKMVISTPVGEGERKQAFFDSISTGTPSTKKGKEEAKSSIEVIGPVGVQEFESFSEIDNSDDDDEPNPAWDLEMPLRYLATQHGKWGLEDYPVEIESDREDKAKLERVHAIVDRAYEDIAKFDEWMIKENEKFARNKAIRRKERAEARKKLKAKPAMKWIPCQVKSEGTKLCLGYVVLWVRLLRITYGLHTH